MDNLDLFNLYIKDMQTKEVPSQEEEQNLLYKISIGDEKARKELVERNWKLVIDIAKRYVYKNIDILDLIQEGNLGLLKATYKFDINKNCRFSTYAIFWVRQSINSYVRDKGRSIRIPAYIYHDMKKVFRKKEILEDSLNRDANKKEVEQITGISKEKIRKYYEYSNEISSLNVIIPGTDMVLHDNISNDEELVEESFIKIFLKEEIERLFEENILKENEVEVIKLRYGFYDNKMKSFKELSEMLNLSRQTIHAIENTALRKIKSSNYFNILYKYTDICYESNVNFVDANMNNKRKKR